MGESTNELNEVVHNESMAQGDQHGDDTHEEVWALEEKKTI